MKTPNTKMSQILLLAMLASLSLLQVACGNKNSGTPTPVVVPAPPVGVGAWGAGGCGIAPGMTPLLSQVTGTTPDNSATFRGMLFGQLTTACFQPPEKRFLCAQGAGGLTGQLEVRAQFFGCPPPGIYNVCMQNPSMMTSGALQGGTYVAQGPGGGFQFLLRRAEVTHPNGVADGQINGLGAEFVIANSTCAISLAPGFN